MPTILCDKDDCQHIGLREPICIARAIECKDGECQSYAPMERLMAVRNPMCMKSHGAYRSTHGRLIK